MSIPLGGFGFNVGFTTNQADAALRAWVQRVGQATREVQASFDAIRPPGLGGSGGSGGGSDPRIRSEAAVTAAIEREAQRQEQAQERARDRMRTLSQRYAAQEEQDRERSRQRILVMAQRADAQEAQAADRAAQQRVQAAEREAQAIERSVASSAQRQEQARTRIRVQVQQQAAQEARAAEAAPGVAQNLLTGAARGAIAGSGLGGNLLIGAGLAAGQAAALGAAVAVQNLTQAVVGGIQASVQYNSRLEGMTNTFAHFAGGATEGRKAMEEFRKLAAASPFGDEQEIAAGSTFLRVSGGDVQRAKELTELTSALASAHPELGFEAMQQAIQQLISGDYRAFEDRTNIAIGSVRELAKQGFSGMELYRKAVELAGGSLELLAKNAAGFQAQLSTFQSTLASLGGNLGKGLFEGLEGALTNANDILAKHREGWAFLAEAIGKATVAGAKYAIPGAAAVLGPAGAQSADFIGGLADQQAARKKAEMEAQEAARLRTPPIPYIATYTDDQQAQIAAATAARRAQQPVAQAGLEKDQGALGLAKADLAEMERQLRSNAAAAAVITAEYEKAVAPLQLQLAQLNQLTAAERERKTEILELQRAQAQIGRRQEVAQGDPIQRADLAGLQVEQEHEQAVMEIRHRRAELDEQLAARQQAQANRTRQDELSVEADRIGAERETAQAAQTGRQEVIEGHREEMRGQQEARDLALERLREEARAHQEVRQVATERLKEEVRGHQEARAAALEKLRGDAATGQASRQSGIESLRDQSTANQQARQNAASALQEQHQAAQEGRAIAMEGLQSRLQGEQQARAAATQTMQQEIANRRAVADAAKEAAQEQLQALERAHQARQDAFRAEIEALQEKDRQIKAAEQGPTRAERELKAMERAHEEQQRSDSLAAAQRQANEATTIRARRDANARVQELRAQQEYERAHQAKQDQIDREKEKREQAAQARQEQIQALQAKAQAEDRAYQQQQQAGQAAIQAADRAEKQRQRQEDAAVRGQEAADRAAQQAGQAQLAAAQAKDRAASRAEQAEERDLEKSNREAEQAEQAQIRAAEQEDRAKTRQEQAAIRAAEEADKTQTRAENEQVRAQEAADKEQTRAENEAIRAAEEADRVKTREENAAIRAEEATAKAAARAEDAAIRAAEKKHQEEVREQARIEREQERVAQAAQIARLEEARKLEIEVLDRREKILGLQNVSDLAQAARDKLLTDHILAMAEASQRIDELTRAIKEGPLQAQIDAKLLEAKTAMVGLDAQKADLDVQIANARVQIDDIQRRIDKATADLQKLRSPGADESPVPEGPPAGDGAAGAAPDDGGAGAAWMALVGNLTTAIAGAWNAFWKTDSSGAGSMAPWFQAAWDAVKHGIFQSDSPSLTASELAYDVATGFILQMAYQGPLIARAMQDAFAVPALADDDPGAQAAYRLANGFIVQMQYQAPLIGQSITDAFAVPDLSALDAIGAEISARIATWGTTVGTGDQQVSMAQAIGTAQAAIWQEAWASFIAPELDAIGVEVAAREQAWGAPPGLGATIGTALAGAWQEGWATQLAPEIDAIGVEIAARFRANGAQAATDWLTGYYTVDVAGAVAKNFIGIQNWLASTYPNFLQLGAGMGQSLVNGYNSRVQGAAFAVPYAGPPATHQAGNAYAQGTNWVPDDQWAYVHKGEEIVPAAFNPRRAGAAVPQGAGPVGAISHAAGTGAGHVSVMVNVQDGAVRVLAGAAPGPRRPDMNKMGAEIGQAVLAVTQRAMRDAFEMSGDPVDDSMGGAF